MGQGFVDLVEVKSENVGEFCVMVQVDIGRAGWMRSCVQSKRRAYGGREENLPIPFFLQGNKTH